MSTPEIKFLKFLIKELKTEADIILLAGNKLRVAEFLVQESFFDDAYYLAAYAFELLLKAKICKTLQILAFLFLKTQNTEELPIMK